MTTRQELLLDVSKAEGALEAAKNAVVAFDSSAENNVYPSMEEAESKIEDALCNLAFEDCQGAHNCGLDTYERQFMVDGKKYEATLHCEYNRHDKTYYYLEESRLEVVEKTA